MDLFLKAKTIRLISHRDKYLVAGEDRVTIRLSRDGSAKNAIWIVEFVDGKDCIRLKSCFGTYLAASSVSFLPGFTGQKVVQTWPSQCDSATEWEPLRDGMQVRMRSLWGNFLRPNGGLPPWRNSITHDVPHRRKTHDKVLWDIEVVEKSANLQRPKTIPASASMDSQQQSDNIRRVLLNNQIEERFAKAKCCWYPKACMRFSR